MYFTTFEWISQRAQVSLRHFAPGVLKLWLFYGVRETSYLSKALNQLEISSFRLLLVTIIPLFSIFSVDSIDHTMLISD
jgi:hypothetical protein